MVVVCRRYRCCTKCGAFKILRAENFSRRKNGYWYSWCRVCRRRDTTERYHRNREDPAYLIRSRAKANAARRRRRQRDPERERERNRREYAQWISRPGVREHKAKRQRRNYAIRSGQLPHSVRLDSLDEPPWQPVNEGGPTLPMVSTEPLREWLRVAFVDWQIQALANRFDVDDRHLGRILRGEARQLSLHTADRILTAADRPDLLVAFYPMEDA